MNDRLTLAGLQFFGRHGTEPWEQEVGRRFEVDVTLVDDFSDAGRSDSLGDMLDYCQVYAAVRDVVEKETHKLIERVAWRVMEEMFGRFGRVREVTVTVRKPEAPLGGVNRCAAIEYTRTRGEFDSQK